MSFEEVMFPDVLADRYASKAMLGIWSPVGKIVLEREFWIAVMRAQRAQGVEIPEQAIEAYERVKGDVRLDRIRDRERRTRHDVKARIEEFCALAGHEHIHKGLTSRDLTENVEQLQVLRSLQLLRVKHAAALLRLADRAEEFRDVLLVARTHNVPAQMTTAGRRLAMFGSEMLLAHRRLEQLLSEYPLRGLKGAVGTQLDLLTLLGDAGKVAVLESEIARQLGFERTLEVVGQVYPRSLDFEVGSVLFQLGSGPANLARTLRLMAGQELASEGFREGQVGSSAMPHKVNSRSCERINGFQLVLNGYVNMLMGLCGDQWNEGDVSCSVVRRVALPGVMFAMDGMLEAFLTVVGEMELSVQRAAMEIDRYLPFLASTTILMEAVRGGAGRERAHAGIKEHTVEAARAQREGRGGSDLVERLASDERIGLGREKILAVLEEKKKFVGRALAQVDAFVQEARSLAGAVAGAGEYVAEEIL